jgi:transcriptional regulator with XRE-family HTH domain
VLTFNPDQIRALREGLGLSQAEMADRINVTKQAVSSWELGDSVPSIDNLLRFVNVTGAKLDSFFVEAEPAGRKG